MIAYVYVFSSVVAIAGMVAFALGYRRSLFVGDKATKWFAWSLLLLSGSFVIRRGVLDLYTLAHPEFLQWRVYVNLFVNFIAILSVYFGLRARWMLIPEEDRKEWHWYSSWMHPGLFGLQQTRRSTYDTIE